MGEEKQPGEAAAEAETPAEQEEAKPEGEETPEKTGEEPVKGEEGKEPEPPAKEPPKEEEEPPTRKTKLDFILERKQKQLEKLKKEKLHKIDDELKGHGVEDDEITPEDESLVTKVVEKKYGKYFSEAEERDAKVEVKEFLDTDPYGKYFKEFESKILKWSRHPSRANVPLRTIAFEVAGDRLLKIGAQIERDAQKKADESKAGGGSARKVEDGKKDFANYTAEEMEAEIAAVKRGNS